MENTAKFVRKHGENHGEKHGDVVFYISDGFGKFKANERFNRDVGTR